MERGVHGKGWLDMGMVSTNQSSELVLTNQSQTFEIVLESIPGHGTKHALSVLSGSDREEREVILTNERSGSV